MPYEAPQVAELGQDVAEINADPDVQRIIHLGDIGNEPRTERVFSCENVLLRTQAVDPRPAPLTP